MGTRRVGLKEILVEVFLKAVAYAPNGRHQLRSGRVEFDFLSKPTYVGVNQAVVFKNMVPDMFYKL